MGSVGERIDVPTLPPNRGELLLELLSEEIPARMQRRAIEDLAKSMDEWLQANRIPALEPIQRYVTPRRMTIIATGIPQQLPLQREERRGPRVGAPQSAVDGFLRSVGKADIEDCVVIDTDRGKFYTAEIERGGRPTAQVLPDLIYAAIAGLVWPKSMRFPASKLRWVRPLVSVICLFDGAELALALDGVPVGRVTRGHRFLAPGEITVSDAADYQRQLEKARVILDQNWRKEMIAAQLMDRASVRGITVKDDPALLDETTGLVEYPVVLMGKIDAGFLRPLPDGLPPEVLATSMRTHQKYFTCLKPDGALAPYFLFVANNETPDFGRTIVAGNERVLRARLSDARFFWDHDRRVPLELRVDALAERVFHAKLGSLRDKVERMGRLAEFLVSYVSDADKKRSRRAVLLAKADLSSGMVGEFPELQGTMGRYYALHDGEPLAVADAIAEHYRPLGPNDACPTAPESVVAALADKIDTLAAFFAIGEKPTGSRDPFALRRAALGTIRLILENKLRLPLALSFSEALHWLKAQKPEIDVGALPYELTAFIAHRLKVYLRERGVRHDLISAAFAQVGTAEDDLVRLLKRVDALESFLASEDGANLLTAFRRASNIVAIEEKRDTRSYGEAVDPSLLVQCEERALAERLAEVGEAAGTFLEREEFQAAMSELARLRGPVDNFFDKVTVNCEDAALRGNRLRLLSRIRATLNRVADFSQIEG